MFNSHNHLYENLHHGCFSSKEADVEKGQTIVRFTNPVAGRVCLSFSLLCETFPFLILLPYLRKIKHNAKRVQILQLFHGSVFTLTIFKESNKLLVQSSLEDRGLSSEWI